jgi:hypothetical protein
MKKPSMTSKNELPSSIETDPPGQSVNAVASRCVTDLGIVNDVNLEQPAKQSASILVSSDPASNDIDAIVESLKQEFASTSTVRGIQIDCKLQKWKQFSLILLNCEPSSNVILPTPADPKHDSERTSTNGGIQIEGMKQPRKQRLPMHLNREPTSNVKVTMELHSKHDSPRSSTERGMQSDCKKHL